MNTHKLYGGKVTLLFDEAHHRYLVHDQVVDGVTSILGVISKPALLPWAAKCAVDHLRPYVESKKQTEDLDQLCKDAVMAHRNKRDKAAEIGTEVHQWIERYINKDADQTEVDLLPPKVKKGVEAFLKWINENHVEFLHSERLVYSKKYNYAGTLDFIAKVNGKLMLGDIKTSSGIYDEMFFQTSAYEHALKEEEHMEFSGNIIVNCQKTGGLKVKVTTDSDKNFRAFLGALTLYRRINELKFESKD